MKLNRKRKGFTLVELIVVVVILGILMGIGALKYADVRRNTNLKTLQANNKTLVSALHLQMATNGGKLPDDLTTKEKMLELVTGITDKSPVGSEYLFDGTTVTTKVGSASNDYPKDASGNPVATIEIKTDIYTGEVTLTPDNAEYFNK